MTVRSTPTSDVGTDDAELGELRTERGSLPLDRVDIRVEITGLTSQIELTQDFVNTFDDPLEASYVFPLPDRAAVTSMRMSVDGRTVEAELREREAAREAYDDAVAAGRRVSITEEERPDVFTIRVGNIVPGQRVGVTLTLVNPLVYEDGEATFRFPLVVAPRYIPGEPLADFAVGDGYADDTDAVPDASRITPPVLAPDFPHRVPVSIDIGIDPAGLPVPDVRSNLPLVTTDDGRIRVEPAEWAKQDFVLRLRYGVEALTSSLVLVPDTDADGDEGTYRLTVLPPSSSGPPRPRDLVLVLDHSASMAGWKVAAARRAAARIVDSLDAEDRFAVLTIGDGVSRPKGLGEGLVEASDHNRYRAVEHLTRVEARGNTTMLAVLRQALVLASETVQDATRDAAVIVITDGQIGNEDQLLRELSSDLHQVRVHTVGVDQAVNAGFLRRLAAVGGGSCDLVESEARLDEALHAIRRHIGVPLARSLTLHADGLSLIEETTSPARLPDLYPGTPLVVTGRYRGSAGTAMGSITLRGASDVGADWSLTVVGRPHEAPEVTAQWARAHLCDLEDRYAAAGQASTEELEKRIVDTSLRFGVLCRFTAFVAPDSRDGRVVAEGALLHRVLQPVEASVGPAAADAQPTPARKDAKTAEAEKPTPRTVKLRNVVAAALIGVVLVGLGFAWSLRGGGVPPTARDEGVVSGKLGDVSDNYRSAPTVAPGAPATRGGAGTESTVVVPEAPPPIPPQSPADGTPFKRDIVTTGSVQLVVAEPADVADRLVAAVTEAGGRVDSRSQQSASQSAQPTVNLALRIPADKLDGVLADAKKLGDVRSMSINHTDVTSQRVDLDARIAALQTSVTRLRELMGRAGTVADLLAAESSLTQRQAELDSLRAQRATLGDEIAYATINVNISTTPTAPPRTGFGGALQQGWQSLLSTLHAIVLTVGFLLPWLPVLAALVWAVVWVLRRRRASRRAAGVEEREDAAASSGGAE
ncbi:hypothetical protein BST27_00115 [Mycobacterium intermedium]|uniref:Trypsin n=1 Tax=Mycobacterium intermedium TaxID=28445 RepID=A0A1E3SFE9_MYCIE|nr:DUF4349 domain-containing protein [Mycobacterium intermedium]MCV6966669.1 DUF4349 domain-containing protein [Mycobacterium intermedium]ODR00815.1 hypothetical protein BHQ20_11530 [Mycobacterium intermedium]OPE52134.1 hypothetical protein BV508_03655 [Mycobacterium intermedium]ORB10578.1 hypothetical protein BST27_00115 [Mycobacterium intermedium]